MQHYTYLMRGNDPAPAGGGDTKSWFEYYKVGTGPDVFVPFTSEQLPPEHRPNPGDYLWFFMDGFLTGVTKVTGVLVDPLNNAVVEVYYDSDRVVPTLVADFGAPEPVTGRVVDVDQHALFTTLLQSLAIDR